MIPAHVFARYVIATYSGIIWGAIVYLLTDHFVAALIVVGVAAFLTSAAVDLVQRRRP